VPRPQRMVVPIRCTQRNITRAPSSMVTPARVTGRVVVRK
jgi:hypothetical protein